MGGDTVNYTICADCGHRVYTAPGFCSVCGSVFQEVTIKRQVAPAELQHQEEMKWYVNALRGPKSPSVTVTLRLAA